MRSRVLAYLLPAACLLYAQQPAPLETNDRCRIQGRAVNAMTGEPVQRANLTLRMTTSLEATPRTAVSDADGRFFFEGLPPGTYMLLGERNGFVTQPYGTRPPTLGPTPLPISAGQVVKGVEFRLVPQAVIAGKVVDDEGVAVSRAMVRAVATGGARGIPPLPLGMATTNDVGEFRIAGLSAGQYVLAVSHMPMSAFSRGEVRPQDVLITTYHPSAATFSDATPLEVKAGQDLTGITIQMRRGRVYAVEGTVVATAVDRKFSDLTLRLMPRDTMRQLVAPATILSGGAIKPDGAFEIRNVEPGEYNLILALRSRPGAPLARLSVVVAQADVKGVVLKFGEPIKITGVIRMEGPQEADFSGSRIGLREAEGMSYNAPYAAATADGAFTVEDVSRQRYMVEVTRLPTGAYVKSIRLGGQEIGDTGIDLSQASSAPSLEILVSPSGATLEGVITAAGKPAAGSRVVLVPDPLRAELALRRRIGIADQNGKFSIRGVPPGEYRLYAFADPLFDPMPDPGFLKSIENKAVKVSLREGDRKQVEVTLVRSADAR
jgi:hypothetical protein